MRLKGIDDLLAAGRTPTRLVREDVAQFFAEQARQFVGADDRRSAEDEPQPAINTTPPTPPFPIDVFPVPVREFAEQVAEAMTCPVDFLGVAILTTAAAAIGAARSVRIKGGWFEKPGLFAAIVSPPGTTKTPALRAVTKPLHDAQAIAYAEFKAAKRTFVDEQREFAKLQQQADGAVIDSEEPEPPPPMPHFFASDTTVEALRDLLKDNSKGLLVFRDELTSWVEEMNRYRKGSDRQFYLSVWSGETVKVDRVSKKDDPIVLTHPFVAVLGGLQPDLLKSLPDSEGRADGFVDRILFAFPDRSPVQGWSDVELSDDNAAAWKLVVDRLLALQLIVPEEGPPHPKVLEIDPNAKVEFVQFCEEVAAEMNEADFPEELRGSWSKLRSHCARLALVLYALRIASEPDEQHAAEGPITAADMLAAIRLCHYFQAHHRVVMGRLRDSAEDVLVEKVMNYLERKDMTRITVRKICNSGVGGLKAASEARRILGRAVDRGLGRWEAGEGKKSAFVLE